MHRGVHLGVGGSTVFAQPSNHPTAANHAFRSESPHVVKAAQQKRKCASCGCWTKAGTTCMLCATPVPGVPKPANRPLEPRPYANEYDASHPFPQEYRTYTRTPSSAASSRSATPHGGAAATARGRAAAVTPVKYINTGANGRTPPAGTARNGGAAALAARSPNVNYHRNADGVVKKSVANSLSNASQPRPAATATQSSLDTYRAISSIARQQEQERAEFQQRYQQFQQMQAQQQQQQNQIQPQVRRSSPMRAAEQQGLTNNSFYDLYKSMLSRSRSRSPSVGQQQTQQMPMQPRQQSQSQSQQPVRGSSLEQFAYSSRQGSMQPQHPPQSMSMTQQQPSAAAGFTATSARQSSGSMPRAGSISSAIRCEYCGTLGRKGDMCNVCHMRC